MCICNCTVQKKDVRHWRDPQTIEEYYSSNIYIIYHFHFQDSVVCSTCYHAYLVKVKRHRLTRHDSNLQIVLDSLRCDEPEAQKDTECIKLLGASKTASFVGNGLLEQKPMLLVTGEMAGLCDTYLSPVRTYLLMHQLITPLLCAN